MTLNASLPASKCTRADPHLSAAWIGLGHAAASMVGRFIGSRYTHVPFQRVLFPFLPSFLFVCLFAWVLAV